MSEKKTQAQKDAEHRAALAGEDAVRAGVEPSPEVHDVDGPHGAVQVYDGRKGLPKDEVVRVALTDPTLAVSEMSGRQWRLQYELDEDGVLKTGSERWVEVTQQGAIEIAAED